VIRRRGKTRGQATVELALVLPLFLGLLLLLAQVGLVLRDQLLVVHAAREGARAAAVGPTRDRARAGAVAAGSLDPARLDVGVATVSGPAGSRLVRVTVSYRSITGLPIIGPLLGDVSLSETVTMRVESG
jgi:Flp pilus assembly protein TadG